MYKKHLLGLLLSSTVVACGSTDATTPNQSPTPETSKSPIQTTQQVTTKPNQVIPTETLSPKPINITVAQLPEPFHTQSVSKSPQVIPPPATSEVKLKVPTGFTVNIFADDLERPRWLALTPSGDVLVTETPQNRISLLQDTDGDGVAETRQTFATAENGLNLPLGMAFASDYFFLGNTDEIRRFSYSQAQDKIVGTGEKIADLPGQGYNQHWTRNVVISPDEQKLYASIGSESNVSPEPLPRASVQVMNLDGSNQETFAHGLRNPVGLDFHPQTGELYTTVNERDGIGDDLVPDYLTRIQKGEFYGWPYAYFKPNLLDPRRTNNGQSDRPDLASKTLTPDVLFQAHSAALGLQFYDGNTFPEKYKNGAFVAFRGSWNRNAGTGYKIVFIPFNDQNRPEGYYEDFFTGFLTDPSVPKTWGRPVGVLVLPDGSLIFTEEGNGRIYRVQYTG